MEVFRLCTRWIYPEGIGGELLQAVDLFFDLLIGGGAWNDVIPSLQLDSFQGNHTNGLISHFQGLLGILLNKIT